MNLKLEYEDTDIAILNKPAGMVVNAAESVKSLTVQEWFTERILNEPAMEEAEWRQQVPDDFDDQYGSPLEIFVQRGGIVHRLDKDTSGVLVLAKHPGSLLHLLRQFRERETKKTYQCLVHGHLAQQHGTIDAPIARSQFNRHTFVVDEEGRVAQTEFRVLGAITQDEFLERLDSIAVDWNEVNQTKFMKQAERLYQGFSLVECKPRTGRTHQIRVHMKYLNNPLVSDQLYVGKKRARLDLTWCPRQYLHASQIEIQHPRTNDRVTFSAELASDLPQLL